MTAAAKTKRFLIFVSDTYEQGSGFEDYRTSTDTLAEAMRYCSDDWRAFAAKWSLTYQIVDITTLTGFRCPMAYEGEPGVATWDWDQRDWTPTEK
jgi:hypothetical protein